MFKGSHCKSHKQTEDTGVWWPLPENTINQAGRGAKLGNPLEGRLLLALAKSWVKWLLLSRKSAQRTVLQDAVCKERIVP